MSRSERYRLDPADPRAPSLEVWAELSATERQQLIEHLPSEIELGPPEGDLHRVPKQRGLEALDAYFRRTGRKVYLSSELPVYYPGERMFAPDIIAVCDVDPGERMRWVVAAEGTADDAALEAWQEQIPVGTGFALAGNTRDTHPHLQGEPGVDVYEVPSLRKLDRLALSSPAPSGFTDVATVGSVEDQPADVAVAVDIEGRVRRHERGMSFHAAPL